MNKKNWLLVGLMALVIFIVYSLGCRTYSWLEDGDPYDHVSAVKFIAEFGHPFQSAPYPIHYLMPYPPLYDMLATIFFKISGMSVIESLKTFNCLLCALTIPAFYLWAKERFGERTGLWATFIIFALPSFMSHFIWAQSLAILLMFPAMYLFEKKSFWFVPAMALVLITQPMVGLVFTVIMGIYSLFVLPKDVNFKEPKQLMPIIFVIAGVLVALIVFWLPTLAFYGLDAIIKQNSVFVVWEGDTGNGVVYGIMDFINAPTATKIDQPTGWGLGIFVLTLIGLILAVVKKTERDLFLVLLFVFCLLGVEGNALPVKLTSHRFWVFLAVPVALLSAKAVVFILEWLKNFDTYRHVFLMFVVLGVLWLSFSPKAEVEMMQWSPGVFTTDGQLQGYLNLQKAYPGEYVFNYCLKEQAADGMGLNGIAWDTEVIDRKNLTKYGWENDDYQFLKDKGYRFVVVDESCVLNMNNKEIPTKKIVSFFEDPRYKLEENVSIKGRFLVFEVK